MNVGEGAEHTSQSGAAHVGVAAGKDCLEACDIAVHIVFGHDYAGLDEGALAAQFLKGVAFPLAVSYS